MCEIHIKTGSDISVSSSFYIPPLNIKILLIEFLYWVIDLATVALNSIKPIFDVL